MHVILISINILINYFLFSEMCMKYSISVVMVANKILDFVENNQNSSENKKILQTFLSIISGYSKVLHQSGNGFYPILSVFFFIHTISDPELSTYISDFVENFRLEFAPDEIRMSEMSGERRSKEISRVIETIKCLPGFISSIEHF